MIAIEQQRIRRMANSFHLNTDWHIPSVERQGNAWDDFMQSKSQLQECRERVLFLSRVIQVGLEREQLDVIGDLIGIS